VLSLVAAGVSLAEGVAPAIEDGAIRMGNVTQPINDDGSFLIAFDAPADRAHTQVAPSKVLEWVMAMDASEDGAFPEEGRRALEGRIVVFGVHLAGQEDAVASPMHPAHPGPLYQAAALDDLLNGTGRILATRAENGAFLAFACLFVGVAGTMPRRRRAPHLAAGAAFVLVLVWAVGAFAMDVAYDVLTPVIGVLLTWIGVYAFRYFAEGRYNRWLEGTFGLYLSAGIIDAIKRDPSVLRLGGVRREITVLFSDVAGFTKMSEGLDAEQLVTLLNEYLTPHSDAVLAEEGVVDKYIGDAVMAFFGDPIPYPDHAVRACRCALSVIERLPELRPVWEGFGLPGFPIRIGLNTGVAVMGNMGSRQRFSYTAMGDTVNLASRLEGANKAFGSTILIGDATRREAGDAILAKPLARLGVVGRGEPVAVHELVAMSDRATPEQVAHVAAFERAREALMRGDADAAHAALDEAERLHPGDGPVAWLRGIARGPLPWDGTLILSSK
jgi:adenylate cyclase